MFRLAFKMTSGRTSYSEWMDKNTVWQLIYTHRFLLSDEWLGIQEKGKSVEIVKVGPWFNEE
jgi:hypothetical protein